MRVAPVFLVLRVAEPLVGDAHAAGERDVAVDDERLPMGPVVVILDGEEAEWVEPGQLRAGGFQPSVLFGFIDEPTGSTTMRTVTPR